MLCHLPFQKRFLHLLIKTGASLYLIGVGSVYADNRLDHTFLSDEGKTLISGGHHNCVILQNDQIKCWGDNVHGQLGLGIKEIAIGDQSGEMGENLPAIDLGTNLTIKAAALGFYHTCAILSDNHVKCWGNNYLGQLGAPLGQNFMDHQGDEPDEMGNHLPRVNLGTNVTVKNLISRTYHTCAILNNNQMKCWGFNYVGQLGQGHKNVLGDDHNEMGDKLLEVNLGTDHLGKKLTAKAMALGSLHTCVILSNDQVKCWGGNRHGQLGLGHREDIGDESNEMGNHLAEVDLGTDSIGNKLKPKKMTAGAFHTCVILNNNQIKCWGRNWFGQLGLGHKKTIGDDPMDQLDPVLLGEGLTAKAIDAGFRHTCAILNDNRMKCWGRNHYGQLGQENRRKVGTKSSDEISLLPPIQLGTDLTVQEIALGRLHTCAVLSDNQVKCWGFNFRGQLGQSHKNPLGDDPEEMGDSLPSIDLGAELQYK